MTQNRSTSRVVLRRLLPLALPILTSTACRTTPPKTPTCNPQDLSGCIIEEVDVLGNDEIPDAAIKDSIATAESAHPLGGVLQGIPIAGLSDVLAVEYERFDRFVLERDLTRIERYYRTRGFYEAHVEAGRVMRRKSDGKIRIEIVVHEGKPVNIRKVDLAWVDWRMPDAADVTRPVTEAKNELPLGKRFEENSYEATKKAITRVLTDRGFPYANVRGDAKVDLVAHTADVTYHIELGPRATFGDIRIEGLGELPEKPIRAALGFHKGERFSTKTLASAERALADFGIFGAIDVRPELPPPDKPRTSVVPITIVVQPAALRAVKLGFGAEAGGRVEAHGVASWEDRNFLGGLRRFAIEARPGLVFYPNALYNLFLARPSYILPEIRLRFELRQPGVFEPRTQAVLRGAGNVYRPLNIITAPAPGTPEAKEPALGYREAAVTLGLERRFSDFTHYLGQFIHVQYDDPFLYWHDAAPEGFTRLLFTYLETVGTLDFRQNDRGETDRVAPRRGVYLNLNAQLAGYFLPGAADDVRLRPEFRAYVPVAKRVTLAFRLAGGFLIPRSDDFKQTLEILEPKARERKRPDEDDDGIVDGTNVSLDDLRRSLQLLQFRGFYSGGPNSNRGYIYNGVGMHASVPLRDTARGAVPPWAPTGGLTLWESALEVRLSFTDNLGAILFLDASDVRPGLGELALTRPHLSAGLGLRYATPVGPVRVDVGYRVPCAQQIGICDEAKLAYDVGLFGYTGGFPIVTTIAIGEAF
ncbi:autotransporter assembly complex protein TamA [Polyangium jinanense]|uniref:BamA/TamA family outer membrane protein n=1 Tax=Polyangium jinanense TaxID=2829994 RepID=A0A9X3X9D5_9BACT|nr:outer membrane protein assembly factor [Polyangium jinanense]MDC3986607.1 BamA/TamA family outer membrane protein [Polyangium jinanense]